MAPAFDFKPSAQLVQAAELVWAVAAENLPATQSMQTLAASAEYVPAAQSVQIVAAPVEYLPSSQKKQSIPSLYLPAGQGWQSLAEKEPSTAVNLPVGQLPHAPELVSFL